jgi:hypothetical protein
MQITIFECMELVPVKSLLQSNKSSHQIQGNAASMISEPLEGKWCKKIALDVGFLECGRFLMHIIIFECVVCSCKKLALNQ